MPAKHTILEKLRCTALPRSDSGPIATHATVSQFDAGAMDLKTAFIQTAEELACRVYALPSPEGLAAVLDSILKNEKVVAAWHWNSLPYANEVAAILAAKHIRVGQPSDSAACIGITGVDAAFAASGSIVLKRSPSQPAGPSLLPPIHIALITEEQIMPSFEAWVAQQRRDDLSDFRQSGNIVIVSGPSRTADIAMQLILGMHGPKELHLIILPENGL